MRASQLRLFERQVTIPLKLQTRTENITTRVQS